MVLKLVSSNHSLKLIQLPFFKTLLLLSNLRPQRKLLKKLVSNNLSLKTLRSRLTFLEKFIEELPVKVPCSISCLFNFALLIRCTNTPLNLSLLSSSKLLRRLNRMKMMRLELWLWEKSLEWPFTNGFLEVFSRNISKFSDLNWLSDLCRRKSSMLNTLKEKCNSCLLAHQAKQFQTHWKNGYQILLGTQWLNFAKSKDSNNSDRMLRKKHQIDSKIGTMISLQRMRSFLLSGKNLSKCHSRNFWLSEYWDQIELLLPWITSWERFFQKEMNMLTVIQHPTSSRSCILLSLIPPQWLQFTSSYHQELIQLSLLKNLPKTKVLTLSMSIRFLLDKVKMLSLWANLILVTKKAIG